jgi:hypothetical protein
VPKTPELAFRATCRLNSMLWERCLAMAFILLKAQFILSNH